jgi:hypothetical protein
MPYPRYRPFFVEDTDTRDYDLYDASRRYAIFTPDLESAVRRLARAFLDRGGAIHVAFTRLPMFRQFDATCVSLAQGWDPLYHAEVWFGEDVVQLGASSRGVNLYSLPRQDGVWEVVRLPFTDPELALRIGVDTVRGCQKGGVQYGEHLWQNLDAACRLLYDGDLADRWGGRADYDEERPETWTGGVHCSQFVLLFLKRCVRHGAVAPASDPLFLLGTHSHTCLPGHLRGLLDLMWGGRLSVQTRDLDSVPEEVRRTWYTP